MATKRKQESASKVSTAKVVKAKVVKTAKAVNPADSGKAARAVRPKHDRDHFEIIGSPNRRFTTADDRYIDLRFGVPSDAVSLYKSGTFPYIGLKESAVVLFKKEPKALIEKLIKQAPRSADVIILKKLL